MHITSQAHLFYQLTYLPQPISLAAMNGAVMGTGVAVGSIRFRAPTGTTFDVHNILLVPSCKRNLLSGLQLAAAGLIMLGDTAGGGWRLVHDSTGQVVAKYQRHDNSNQLYLDIHPLPPSAPSNVHMCHASLLSTGTLAEWHNRLGHPSSSVIQHLFSHHLTHGGALGEHSRTPGCPSCKSAHLAQLPYPVRLDQITRVLEVVHSDLCEFPIGYEGNRYMLVMVDQFSRFVWTFPLKQKSDVGECVHHWIARAQRQLQAQLNVFSSDSGGEFTVGSLQQ